MVLKQLMCYNFIERSDYMFLLFLCLSITIFICFIVYAYLNRNKYTQATTIALLGVIISTGFLVYPLHNEIDFITNLLKTIIYAIKMPSINSSFELLKNAPKELFKLYEYLLYLYCVSAPILTAGVIISFINKILDEFRSNKKTKKNVHIFSSINEKSLILAESISNENNFIVFCSKETVDRDRIRKINGVIINKKIKDINFKKYHSKIYIYEIDNNQEKNLNDTLSLIDKIKNNYKNIEIYIFTNDEEARIIMDSTNKYNIKTTIVDEVEQMVYKVLDDNPLFNNCINKQINTLIIGCGVIGSEFLKAITWCGQMIDYKLSSNVIDIEAQRIKKELMLKYPELISNYNINFYENDIKSSETFKLITDKFKDTSYIIINLGNDRFNLDIALNLRREFLRIGKMPTISLAIKDKYKLEQIQILKNEKGNEYNLYPYGDIEELYNIDTIINKHIEELAKKVHLAYDSTDTKLINYFKIEYNKKSSRATALHIKYKLFSILGDNYNNKNKIKEIFKDKAIIDKLAENEHNRWNAYIRSDGYKLASINNVKDYYPKTNHHIYHLAKLHPALVDFDELDKVSEELSKIKKEEVNLKASDYFIVKTIPKLISIKEEKD